MRRGYTPRMLEELCKHAGLVVEQISYCSGFLSQKVTWLLRELSRIHHLLAWAVVPAASDIAPTFGSFDTQADQLAIFQHYAGGLQTAVLGKSRPTKKGGRLE